MLSTTVVIISTIAILPGIVLVLESIAAIKLKHQRGNQKRGFLINWYKLRKPSNQRERIMSRVIKHYLNIDAALGVRMRPNRTPYRHVHSIGKGKRAIKLKNYFEVHTDDVGFVANHADQQRDYATISQNPHILKILITGNSVSAGFGVSCSEKSWPAMLETKLNDYLDTIDSPFTRAVVINSSTLSHKISQEVKRFCDETLYLNPHLVITFGGGLTDFDYSGNATDDANHDFQAKINAKLGLPWFQRQELWLPNIKQLFFAKSQQVNNHNLYPYRNGNTPRYNATDLTLSKIKQFKGLCDSHGIHYLFLLQPGMGAAPKPLSKSEIAQTEHFHRFYSGVDWKQYEYSIAKYYANLRSKLTEDYQHDLSKIFCDENRTTYADPRHQNDLGHQLLLEKIEPLVKVQISKITKKGTQSATIAAANSDNSYELA